MEIIKRIKKWQKDRLLDKQEFNDINEFTNILEELLEMIGINIDKQDRKKLKELISIFIVNTSKTLDKTPKEPTDEDRVDAFADIIVFSVGAIMKLGYEPTCVMNECLKEIESRIGSIIDGKFQKDLSKKHLWYKADYSKCKRKD